MTTRSQEPSEPDDRDAIPEAFEGGAPDLPAAEDVRVGPEESDEPQAGATEPTD
jgi:hypothetical protein